MSKATKACFLTVAFSSALTLAASATTIGNDTASRNPQDVGSIFRTSPGDQPDPRDEKAVQAFQYARDRDKAARISWLLTVPPDAPVTINSDFGRFRIPIGYLNERFAFLQNPFAPDYGPTKFDIADEQALPTFSFNFWVPDGGMVRDSQPQVENNRPLEPDHPKPRLQDFVVLMMSSEPAHADNFRRAAIEALPEKLGKSIGVETNDPRLLAYKGAIRSPTHDRYLRFYLECGRLDLCQGWMVIDHRDMAMRVIVPPDGINAMFDALKIADRLLDAWETPG
jgi:hypothetical protein